MKVERRILQSSFAIGRFFPLGRHFTAPASSRNTLFPYLFWVDQEAEDVKEGRSCPRDTGYTSPSNKTLQLLHNLTAIHELAYYIRRSYP